MNISKEEFPDHILVQVVGRLDTVHAKSFETYVTETIRNRPQPSSSTWRVWTMSRARGCARG